MIVLDEQLLGRNIEEQIARWYQGAICFITDLRPNTVIKDDAIPKLLQQENQPTCVKFGQHGLLCYTFYQGTSYEQIP